MVNFALQTRKTSQNHDFFIKNQAKSLIFHGFPCQNFPTVNPSSRHAYRRAVRPLWRLPSRVPKIAQKSKKFEKNGTLKIAPVFLKGRFFWDTF